MKAKLLNEVGGTILRPGNIRPCNSSINTNCFGFRSNITNKNRKFCIDSNYLTEFGSIISSIGEQKPILIFRPYLGETFLEISMSGEDFLHLDTQFTYPLIINQIPFKVHAECINNKSLLSIELTKALSYSNYLKGLLFAKYGKSLDFNVEVTLPFSDLYFLVDSSQLQFNSSFGIHDSCFKPFPTRLSFLSPYLSSFFMTYQFISDYLFGQHQIGCYIQSKQKLNILSILYNINQKEINFKAQSKFKYISFASSINMKLNDQKENDREKIKLTNFQLGASFLPFYKNNSICKLQLVFPDYKTTAKFRTELKQKFTLDFSTSYSITERTFEFGFNFICNS